MNERDGFEERLRQARSKQGLDKPPAERGKAPQSPWGFGLRAGVEVVSALVVGLPINMDGTEGPRAQSCRAFARNLERLRPVNVAFWDERLSTSAVERFLIEDLDLNRKRRAQVVDRTAAAWILQGALDRVRDQASWI